MKKKRKANRATTPAKIFSYPRPAVPFEHLPEEIAHCDGAPLLRSQEERRQQISVLVSRQATHGAHSIGEARAFSIGVNKRKSLG